MVRKNTIINLPDRYRTVIAEYAHTGQGVHYFTIGVDGNLTHKWVSVPEDVRPLTPAVIAAYREKYPEVTETADQASWPH